MVFRTSCQFCHDDSHLGKNWQPPTRRMDGYPTDL